METISIIKNTCRKFYFHPIDFIFLIVIILSGMFKDFLWTFCILIIHELGHYTLAHYYHWEVKQIAIYPFGGCVKLDEELNRPIKEEFLILIAGPIFQILLYSILVFFHQHGQISTVDFSIIQKYHFLFLKLNLLPIYPLDGGRLLYLLLQKLLPYQKASKVVSAFSLLFLSGFLIKNFSLPIFLFLVPLLWDIYHFAQKIPYLYQRFLLERYLNNYFFKKIRKISSIKNCYKGYRHLIKDKTGYKTEKAYLKEYFYSREE